MCGVKSAAPGSGFKFSVASCRPAAKDCKNRDSEAGRLGVARCANQGRNKASCRRRHRGVKKHLVGIIEFLFKLFRRPIPHETILINEETIFRFRADIRKQPLVISYPRSEHTASTERETANADSQLHPGFRVHPGR